MISGFCGKRGVEVFGEALRESESLDDGEDHGDDRHQRHQRVERERRRADDGPVFEQARAV